MDECRGIRIHPTNDESPTIDGNSSEIWRFLYDTGFVKLFLLKSSTIDAFSFVGPVMCIATI